MRRRTTRTRERQSIRGLARAVTILLLALFVSAHSIDHGEDVDPAAVSATFDELVPRVEALWSELAPEQLERIRAHAVKTLERIDHLDRHARERLSAIEERRGARKENHSPSDGGQGRPPLQGRVRDDCRRGVLAAPEGASGDSHRREGADDVRVAAGVPLEAETPEVPQRPRGRTGTFAPTTPGRDGLTTAQRDALLREGVRAFGTSLATAARSYDLRASFLLCVMRIESAYDLAAISSAGAIGLMQLMPTTAAELGANPYDLSDNVLAGARLIDQNLRHYGEDVTLAMAAYNAGRGAVERHGGVPPYSETRQYVERIGRDCGPARP